MRECTIEDYACGLAYIIILYNIQSDSPLFRLKRRSVIQNLTFGMFRTVGYYGLIVFFFFFFFLNFVVRVVFRLLECLR